MSQDVIMDNIVIFPEGFRPSTTVFSSGIGGGFSSTTQSQGQVATNGYFSIRSADTYAKLSGAFIIE